MQNRTGGLFTKNYQRIEVQDEEYLTQLVNYIHKNPVRHGIQKDYENYIYSSYKIILGDSKTILNREDVIHWFGGKNEFIKYHHSDNVDATGYNLLNIESDDEVIE